MKIGFLIWINGSSALEKILKEDFHGTSSRVEVDLHIHLVTADHVILDSVHAILLEGNAIFNRSNDAQNTGQVKFSIGSTRKVGIPQ